MFSATPTPIRIFAKHVIKQWQVRLCIQSRGCAFSNAMHNLEYSDTCIAILSQGVGQAPCTHDKINSSALVCWGALCIDILVEDQTAVISISCFMNQQISKLSTVQTSCAFTLTPLPRNTLTMASLPK